MSARGGAALIAMWAFILSFGGTATTASTPSPIEPVRPGATVAIVPLPAHDQIDVVSVERTLAKEMRRAGLEVLTPAEIGLEWMERRPAAFDAEHWRRRAQESGAGALLFVEIGESQWFYETICTSGYGGSEDEAFMPYDLVDCPRRDLRQVRRGMELAVTLRIERVADQQVLFARRRLVAGNLGTYPTALVRRLVRKTFRRLGDSPELLTELVGGDGGMLRRDGGAEE